MTLRSGICTVFARTDVSGEGEMPRFAYVRRSQGYYGELDFATDGAWTTPGREDVVIDARIRVLQDRRITQRDAVVLGDAETMEGANAYEVERAWHGRDEESGMLISDLSLRRVQA